MHDTWFKNLSISPLFQGIDEAGLQDILACFQPHVAGFKKGEYICIEGDQQTSIGVLLSGKLNIVRESITGNRQVMAILAPGDIFGEMAAFTDRKRWPASVTAVEVSEIMYIPIERFSVTCAKSCNSHAQLIRNMLQIISKKAMVLNRKVEYLTVKGMREKLCRYFIELYQQKKLPTFEMDMNRNELADFLNVSRPSMSREMGRMRDEGLIDFYRGSVRILLPDELMQYCPEVI